MFVKLSLAQGDKENSSNHCASEKQCVFGSGKSVNKGKSQNRGKKRRRRQAEVCRSVKLKSKSTLDSVAWSNVEKKPEKKLNKKLRRKKNRPQVGQIQPIFRPSGIFGISLQSTVTHEQSSLFPQNPTQCGALVFPVYCLCAVYCRRGCI